MQLGSGGQRAEINITPLIDVLLVLLIIFMVIQPQKSQGLAGRIPQPADGKLTEEAAHREIVIRILEGGKVEVNSQAVLLADLAGKIRQGLRPGETVFVQGESSLEFQEVARVLDVAREAGAGSFAFLPLPQPQR